MGKESGFTNIGVVDVGLVVFQIFHYNNHAFVQDWLTLIGLKRNGNIAVWIRISGGENWFVIVFQESTLEVFTGNGNWNYVNETRVAQNGLVGIFGEDCVISVGEISGEEFLIKVFTVIERVAVVILALDLAGGVDRAEVVEGALEKFA